MEIKCVYAAHGESKCDGLQLCHVWEGIKRLEMKMKLIQIATLAAVAQRDAEIVVVHLLIVISYF